LITDLMHIGIYTRDPEASIDFYVRGLGFALTWRGIVSHKTGRLPVATLKVGSCAIELVQPSDEKRARRQEGPLQHLALQVDDLDQTIAELGVRGIRVTEGPEDIPYEDGIKHCFIRGPNNERIELCQRRNQGSKEF